MAKSTNIYGIQNVNNPDGVIVNATGTAKVTIWTAGANDSILTSLGMSTDDSAQARLYQFWVNIGGAGTDRLLGTVNMPASAGNDGITPSVDILRSGMFQLSRDGYGNWVFKAKAGTLLKVACTTTVTSPKNAYFFGDGGDL